MSSLDCPFCGPRMLEEFAFQRTCGARDGDAVSRVYLRTERVDRSLEYWQHVQGCRAWLTVVRNPSTGEILSVRMLQCEEP